MIADRRSSPVVTDLVVIFRTHSDIEAQIVRGLLETHGVMSVVSSDVLHSVFPMSVDGLTEVRIAVHAERGGGGAAHHRRPPDGAQERRGACGCGTSSVRCSRRSAIASAIGDCSSTR